MKNTSPIDDPEEEELEETSGEKLEGQARDIGVSESPRLYVQAGPGRGKRFCMTRRLLTLIQQKRVQPEARQGQVMVIDVSMLFVKVCPKNVFADEGVRAVGKVYHAWEEREKFSRVLSTEELRANDYNLSSSAYIQVGEKATHRDLADILVDLGEARVARERADRELEAILGKLGLGGGS